jgi:RNA polymerase sigma-70 factor (ECF subfamily)
MREWLTTSTVLDGLCDFDDRTTWQRFAERFRRPIVSFARGMGLNSAEAEDAAQETLLAFAKALRGGRYDRSKGRLSKWLFGIAYRQALNARRARGRGPVRPAGGGVTSIIAAIPDKTRAGETWDIEWERAVLDRCIKQVRREVAENTFRAFDLIVRKNKSTDEAAEALGMSRAAVYTAKHRVLKRVRELRPQFENVA